jgi:hypothetical protein
MRYVDRNEDPVYGIVVVLVLVVLGFWISRTSRRTTTRGMYRDIKGQSRG